MGGRQSSQTTVKEENPSRNKTSTSCQTDAPALPKPEIPVKGALEEVSKDNDYVNAPCFIYKKNPH